MNPQKSEHYTFGDTESAAQRLELLARVFEPGSASLLAQLPSRSGALGIDLGCGPGHTTRLLAEQTDVERVLGLDQSPRLLQAAARRYASERVEFACSDVTLPPFPTPPASILYARFLLTHLREPNQVIASWASAALPGALLVLEETASMHGEDLSFSRYYGLVERMQAYYGQRMYVGRELAELARAAAPTWTVEHAAIAPFALPAAEMAQLHLMNLRNWSRDPFALANYDPSTLDELASALEAIALGATSVAPVAVAMGQVVLRRH